jgi:hypothetical protein
VPPTLGQFEAHDDKRRQSRNPDGSSANAVAAHTTHKTTARKHRIMD